MGQKVSRKDFEWTYTEEPHATRRKLIIEKYPQIKKLFGYDPKFKFIVCGIVLVQVLMLFVMKDRSWPTIFIAAYCFGGILNHSLMVAEHEIAHNLAFGHSYPMANRLLGIFCNLPIGVPISIAFRKYHFEHHRYLAVTAKDPDVPTLFEAKLFCTTFGKFLWIILQPVFYLVRPLIINPKPATPLEHINVVIQLIFDAVVVYFFGWRVLVYLVAGSLLSMGIHPMGGHFIAEHYMFAKGFETYSYYGPLNWITFNVGYHNEHHDFPAVPGSRLPMVKKIAPEFYDTMPQHTSWTRVLYDFVMDPSVGPYARVIRKQRGLSS